MTIGRPCLSAFGAARSLGTAAELAPRLKAAGFERWWIPEGPQPVFEICSAAALSTTALGLGTSVAVAFARSPMLTAQAAWLLAQATGGRFILGLGTQVRAHVERRYSAAFGHPVARMREYVEALRAIYAAFRGHGELNYSGDFYSFSLLPATWSPGPMEHEDPPVYLAAVRPRMCRLAGEVADGLLVHPLSTRRYLDQVVLPSVAEGQARAGRPAGCVKLVCPVMTAVSDSAPMRARQRAALRSRLAFYGSTPGYEIVFESSGWPGVGERLRALQREGRTETMQSLISDEMLETFSISCPWGQLAESLWERFGGVADEVVCYSSVEQWADTEDAEDRWRDVVRQFGELAVSK